LQIVRDGMRATVTYGTAQTAAIPGIAVAGKTGTAEYCDNIAYPLGLCVQGAWPSHAWFAAFAPYENPEVLAVAFVYNGGEGSGVALPIVRETLEAYFRLKAEREGGGTLPGTSPLRAPTLQPNLELQLPSTGAP
jgi:penicillin-binding protein 2